MVRRGIHDPENRLIQVTGNRRQKWKRVIHPARCCGCRRLGSFSTTDSSPQQGDLPPLSRRESDAAHACKGCSQGRKEGEAMSEAPRFWATVPRRSGGKDRIKDRLSSDHTQAWRKVSGDSQRRLLLHLVPTPPAPGNLARTFGGNPGSKAKGAGRGQRTLPCPPITTAQQHRVTGHLQR
jgi:hypothetical protein